MLQEKEFFEKNTFSASEIDSHKLKFKHLSEAHEKSEKEAFELMTQLRVCTPPPPEFCLTTQPLRGWGLGRG